jgi:hypothetical protein
MSKPAQILLLVTIPTFALYGQSVPISSVPGLANVAFPLVFVQRQNVARLRHP